MVFLLYNKVLLRLLTVACGAGVAVTAWFYIMLSAQKLAGQGVRDALAIVSFLIAGWLVMVIAEVVDNHYVRVFGGLCVILGGIVSFRWIFLVDGPELRELANGPAGMRNVSLGYGVVMLVAVLVIVLLVVRLALDKANSGRVPGRARTIDRDLGEKPEGLGEPPKPAEPEPIPVDRSPLAVTTQSTAATHEPAAASTPGPVAKLVGIGGLYMDSVFELSPGEQLIGRQGAVIELSNDNQVSRRHATITVNDQGIATLADAGSTNGTFVNNQRVQQVELAPGDVVRIGTSMFKAEG